ncbi:MAG: hypothetical protein ABI718_02120 [Acidobacteriota bacterium]
MVSSLRLIVTASALLGVAAIASASDTPSLNSGSSAQILDRAIAIEQELSAKYGQAVNPRLHRGLQQVTAFWRADDGSAADFEDFVRTNFEPDQKSLDALFARLESAMEQIDGHMLEISRELNRQSDLDLGPIQPIDEIMAGYDPSSHLNDDFFGNRLAFAVLLNFPLTTMEQRLGEGAHWSRRQWAEARLASRFSRRIPAEVNLEASKARAEAQLYIAGYNIWMYHLVDAQGRRIFPPGLRLLSHWNLRDELKADYSDPKGLAKQRLIARVMDQIVTQQIPAQVIDNPRVDWNPDSGQVRPAAKADDGTVQPADFKTSNAPEPDTRYAVLLRNFNAQRKVDPYSPEAPTLIARSFENREIPEQRVVAMFEQVLTSPLVPRVASLIQSRLGRKLEPFDIWYNGFRPRGKYTEAELDAIVSKKYPNAEAYAADIPNLLQQLGFSQERARYVAANIVVDPARGSGHAMGAARRGDKSHLRTRVEAGGMNYKGYNIAVHEMGHNVEQTFSLNDIDHTLLAGVPNNAFTEALAFVFQNRDLELLGLSRPDASSESMKTLNDFWGTYEIIGVALVDIRVWHWMYEHPSATPQDLKNATVDISKSIWNRYYAPVFGRRDVTLLGIYSHMFDELLYLPDYPIGHMIAFQIERQMDKAGAIGTEFERMARQGNIAPDLWMKGATGTPVGPEALLEATAQALSQLAPD